ncbi:MAG TPA: hypothetical protein VIR38_07270 [Thalassobaculum sp.]
MPFDAARLKELDAMTRRMGAVASVFDVRSSTIGDRSFSGFRDLMDVYIELCRRRLKQGKDFIEDGVDITAEDAALIDAAFTRVFGRRPDQVTPSE